MRLDGLRILLVEDDDDSRELLDFILQRCGAEVIAVSSVAEAMAWFDRARPDVVVSDISMPGEDGYGLIARIRRLDACAAIPAVAVTGFAYEHHRQRAIAAGFQAHLTKPVDPDTLCESVRRVAARGRR
jgi:CheY-like chemotaxis protein